MSRRWLAALAVPFVFAACGGDAGGGGETASDLPLLPPTSVSAPASPPTTKSPIEGVATFQVDAAHSDAPVNYPQVPPVGGTHSPTWQACTFYDAPVQSEKAVHSLEHGAIWVTYRPDLPPAQIEALAAVARSSKGFLVSRWDTGLPSPLVVTSWGRQLRLESFSDPRLIEFVRIYANQSPEPNGPC